MVTDVREPNAPPNSTATPAPLHAPQPEPEPEPDPPPPPRYLAWTDRWDPGKWEMPDHPTPLQRVLAGVALVIVLVMTVWVPLRLLNIL